MMSWPSASPAQHAPTNDDDTGRVCLTRLVAERALHALERCPTQPQYAELLKTHRDLNIEARATERKRVFAEGQLSEARRQVYAGNAERVELIADRARLRDELDDRLPWYTWAGIGSGAGVVLTVIVVAILPGSRLAIRSPGNS